jgi:hypothetical protein
LEKGKILEERKRETPKGACSALQNEKCIPCTST